MTDKTVHLGRNIKRLREIIGMKQDALARELGDDWNQKKISALESKEHIDDALLEDVARALHIPADNIRSFDEEKTLINIQNNYENSNNQGAVSIGGANTGATYNFNPLDELRKAQEENRQLLAELKDLYERLLKSEQDKVAIMQQLMDKK